MKRENISYIGIFTQHIDGQLYRDIPNQHITLAFRPNQEQFETLLPYIGRDCSYKIIGYGNDGKNEGLQVVIEPGIPYFGAEQQHITLSVAEDGKPVDTGFLQFEENIPLRLDIHNGEIFTGKIGAFTQERVIEYNSHNFDELRAMNIQTIKDTAALISAAENKMPIFAESMNSSKLSYRVNYGEWQSITDVDINKLSKLDGIIDVRVNDSAEPCIIHNIVDGLQMDDALLLVGENICWSNVNFEEEYNDQCRIKEEMIEKEEEDIEKDEIERE